MILRQSGRFFIFVAIFLLLQGSVFAVTYPQYQGYVTDTADMISAGEQQKLEQRLDAYEKETSNEIAVVTVSSLEGETIEYYAVKLFEQWKIGKEDKDNGVLFLVSKNDREMRIEVGYGLEPVITDGSAGSIIRNTVTPAFKEGNFDKGIAEGVEAIITDIGDGEANGLERAVGNNPLRQIGGQEIDWLLRNFGEFLFAIPFAFIYLISYMARTKDVTLGGIIGGVGGLLVGLLIGITAVTVGAVVFGAIFGLILDWILSRNYKKLAAQHDKTDWVHTWGGFGGPKGFGGGGFGGFGGGSSGGGGASGRW